MALETEGLPRKCEALNSNLRTAKKRKQGRVTSAGPVENEPGLSGGGEGEVIKDKTRHYLECR
jgi:hypothetical protein